MIWFSWIAVILIYWKVSLFFVGIYVFLDVYSLWHKLRKERLQDELAAQNQDSEEEKDDSLAKLIAINMQSSRLKRSQKLECLNTIRCIDYKKINED